jgi:hypothetical protein
VKVLDSKYWSICRVTIDGKVDIESGEFYLTATKMKEAGCNWTGRRAPHADVVMPALVRSTDIRENELALAFAQYQAQYKELRAPKQFSIGERIDR